MVVEIMEKNILTLKGENIKIFKTTEPPLFQAVATGKIVMLE